MAGLGGLILSSIAAWAAFLNSFASMFVLLDRLNLV